MKTARIRLLPPHARWLGPAPALGRLIRVSSRGWSATPGSRITAASGWPCCDWAISLARHIFGLSWPATIRCLWLVLRTTQLWAPFPNNNADRARRLTERFYTLVKERYAEPFDPAIAATLELARWRVHRESQHSAPGSNEVALVDALARLYSHVYGVPEPSLRRAAEQRVVALRHSDRWVGEGRHMGSALIDEERAALAGSYIALLAAVHVS